MFEQQQGVGLIAVFDRQFSFLLDREGGFVLDAPQRLDQQRFMAHMQPNRDPRASF
jgi:hypothetical protein